MSFVSRRFYSQIPEIMPSSSRKIFRKRKEKPAEPKVCQKPVNPSPDYRENEFKIQMLTRGLFQQIFNGLDGNQNLQDVEKIERFKSDLFKHGLNIETSPRFPDVEINLPKLHGTNIQEHFFHIGEMQSKAYRELTFSLVKNEIPAMPKKWSQTPGWTKYDPSKGPYKVDYPDEDALVFDVEVCVPSGPGPILACAVGKHYWYSWVSESLQNVVETKKNHKHKLNEFIPLESNINQNENQRPRIIIGHNVSYDRARVKEQYLLEQSKLRFLDTMSLHVAVSGVTSYQRALLKSKKKENDLDDMIWREQTSLNSLSEVYRLYCKKEVSKEPRNIFVEGTLNDVLNNFQDLVTYCAHDVLATHEVLNELFPLFIERFPHPVTLAGMLEIGVAYLPVNSNWRRYINEANLTYDELNCESRQLLAKKAIQACRLMENESYRKDLWMWDQDWSVQPFKLKAAVKKSKKNSQDDQQSEKHVPCNEEDKLHLKFKDLYDLKGQIPAKRPFLAGYPAWYRKLCSKSTPDDPNSYAFPDKISTGMQITPKLLNLCWEGYPLHFIQGQGWGFLVPFTNQRPEDVDGIIPIKELVQKCPVLDKEFTGAHPEDISGLWQDVEQKLSKKDYYSPAKKDKSFGKYKGTGVWSDLILEQCCYFLKLPHKDGPSNRVGNPLSKDFLTKFSDNVLSGDGVVAERVLEIGRMLSYWRNNKDRIEGQLVVWQDIEELLKIYGDKNLELGAIIPQVVVCGTLTRRAMEPTWLTASNAKEQRIGSELRSMIQSPPGYKIVGADVDSQELWIASVLGDAYAFQTHGATPLGWMTLSGTKADGSDMHSVTAKAIGINRDQAKVINYARIYGAGQQFAVQLLKQFNPTISDGQAKSKAFKMFLMTKGKRCYRLLPEYKGEYEDIAYAQKDATRLANLHGLHVSEMFEKPKWEGGTESAMFNRLEDIASQPTPVTPFLNCRLSRALEPAQGLEDRFLPTRINWVVQSGAVDFLHLMLVCMRWLMQGHIRFCLSFHDELRYLVKDEFAYKAALAMHITNLMTRAFCSSAIGLNDLPQSVAFFSSVEVDTVLRKEATLDCKTPSNPNGLTKGYGIPSGETLDITAAIQKAGGADISTWEWHKKLNNKTT